MRRRPLIAHIITGLSTGGAEMMLARLISNSNKARYQHVVVSLMDGGPVSELLGECGIRVYQIGISKGSMPTPRQLVRIVKLLRGIQPNIIQGWMYHGNAAASFCTPLMYGRPKLVWGIHHSLNVLSRERRLTRAAIRAGAVVSRWCQRLVYVSESSRNQHRALGFSDAADCVIPNGFDTEIFRPSLEARMGLREELRLSCDTILIGQVGRFAPIKDHPNFLKACANLLETTSGVRFVLAGRDLDERNADLMKVVTSLKLREHVHLLGERRDIPVLLAGLDVLVSSSAAEAFPLVVGEAMSCGIPCVVTDVGDSARLVGKHGQVVPPQNAAALATGIRSLIEIGPDARIVIGLAARNHIQENFSLGSVVRKYEAIYEELLGQDFGPPSQ